jgi:hypothetical protein
MRTYSYSTSTHLPAQLLYRAIADINRWPQWDDDLSATCIKGPAIEGARFTLTPKGGPRVSMEIEEASAPFRFVDISHLPLAKMRTTHAFTTTGAQTRIDVVIEVWGFLGWLWDRIVARKQAAGAAAQTLKFVAFAGQTT